MNAQTNPHAGIDRLWSPLERVLIAQRIACEHIDAGDWNRAMKALYHADRMARLLPEELNPTLGAMIVADPQPGPASPPVPQPPPAELLPEFDMRPLLDLPPESIAEHFRKIVRMVNEQRARHRLPPRDEAEIIAELQHFFDYTRSVRDAARAAVPTATHAPFT